MNFWRFLKAAYCFQRSMREVPEANDARFWTNDDAKNLDNFLESYTGKKLQLRLTNFAFKRTLEVVRQRGSYSYDCGEAAGIQIGIAALEEHRISLITAQSDESEEQATEAGAFLEPQTP